MRFDPALHHRRSIRLAGFDYRHPGAYFVTICTHERALMFDDPRTRRAVELALLSVGRYCRRASIDEFVVMPNHVHAIIRISGTRGGMRGVGAQHTCLRNDIPPTDPHSPANDGALAACAAPLPASRAPTGTRRVESGSLGAVVRAFKSTTTKRINEIRNTPGTPVWQRNYYEHVIRDEDDLTRIRQYIRDNPAKWADDPDNPANNPNPPSVRHPA